MITDTPLRASLPYRDCVGIALFNAGGQVFIGQRSADEALEGRGEIKSPWQMPQGGIDKGEAPLTAARRELFEETSVTSAELLAEAPKWILYDLPDAALGTALRGKYRGQRQRWFAFAFTGTDSEINVLAPGGGQHPAEFVDWRWESLEATPDLIVPFKRHAYLAVLKAFGHLPSKLRI